MIVPKDFIIPTRIIRPYDDNIPSAYVTKEYGTTQNVCETLASEVEKWNPLDPVLITAPTGRGKSTFVFRELVPRCIQQKKNLLLLSNRVALCTQQKELIFEATNHPLQGLLPASVLREWEDFGCVRVLTYHKLTHFVNDPKNREWLADVMFVVADEAHYYAVDSVFNEWVGDALDCIVTRFKHAIRIYLTATEWTVLNILANAEGKLPMLIEKFRCLSFGEIPHYRRFLRYLFHADYSHVNLQFISGLDYVSKIVEESPNDRVLVFTDSKEKGKQLMHKLNSQFKNRSGFKAIYIDADSKGSQEWEEIIQNQRFEATVLISSQVLDCGINIIDPTLRHCIVSTFSRTALVQMLGRKRCSPGEKVNLYVCDLGENKLNWLLAQAYEIDDLVKEYESWDGHETKARQAALKKLAAKIWSMPDNRFRKFFRYAGNNGIKLNEQAVETLRRQIRFLERIRAGETTFQDEVLSWFGKTNQDAGEKLNAVERLKAFCEEVTGSQLSEENKATMRRLVNNAAAFIGVKEEHPGRAEKYTYIKFNNVFEILGFHFKVDNRYILVRTEAESLR